MLWTQLWLRCKQLEQEATYDMLHCTRYCSSAPYIRLAAACLLRSGSKCLPFALLLMLNRKHVYASSCADGPAGGMGSEELGERPQADAAAQETEHRSRQERQVHSLLPII